MIPEASRRLSPEGREAPWLGARRALVAHEDSRTRDFLKEALWRAGYAADLYAEAGDVLAEGVPGRHALLVMKSGTPEMKALRALRGRGNPIPVLLLSRAAFGAEPPLGPEDGVVERLSMPFTLDMLRAAIARLLRDGSKGESRAR